MLGGSVISNSSFGGCASESGVAVTDRWGFSFHITCPSPCPKRQTWNKGKKIVLDIEKKIMHVSSIDSIIAKMEKLWRAHRWFKGHRTRPLGKNLGIYLMILSKIVSAPEKKILSTEEFFSLVEGGWTRACAWEMKSYVQHLWLVISLIMHWSKLVTGIMRLM